MLDDGRKVIYQVKGEDWRSVVYRDDVPSLLDDYGITMEDVELSPLSDLTAPELASFIGDEMENANQHSLTSVADKVLEGLRVAKFTEEQQLTVLQILGDTLLEEAV